MNERTTAQLRRDIVAAAVLMAFAIGVYWLPTVLLWTPKQLAKVNKAAALLPEQQRPNFLRMVAARLNDLPAPTNDEVNAAIYFGLNFHGVAIGSSLRRELAVLP